MWLFQAIALTGVNGQDQAELAYLKKDVVIIQRGHTAVMALNLQIHHGPILVLNFYLKVQKCPHWALARLPQI